MDSEKKLVALGLLIIGVTFLVIFMSNSLFIAEVNDIAIVGQGINKGGDILQNRFQPETESLSLSDLISNVDNYRSEFESSIYSFLGESDIKEHIEEGLNVELSYTSGKLWDSMNCDVLCGVADQSCLFTGFYYDPDEYSEQMSVESCNIVRDRSYIDSFSCFCYSG